MPATLTDNDISQLSSAVNTLDFKKADGTTIFTIGPSAVTSTLALLIPDGTAAAPSLALSSDSDGTGTGLYRAGANDLGISTNGTLRFDISTTGVTSTLNITAPSFTTSTADASVLGGNANGSLELGVSGGLNNTPFIDFHFNGASRAEDFNFRVINSAASKLDFTAQTGGTPLSLQGAQAAFLAGAVGTPSIAASGDLDTGVWFPAANTFAASAGGTEAIRATTTLVTASLPVGGPVGAVGTPAFTQSGDLDSGLWFPAANTLAWSTGGSERMRLDSSGDFGIGDTSPDRPLTVNSASNPLAAGNASIKLYGQANKERIEIQSFVNGGTAQPQIQGVGAGGTVASPTATPLDTILLGVGGGGYDNAGTPAKASAKGLLTINAAEAWTTAAQGTYYAFATTAIGGTTRSEKLRLDSTGHLLAVDGTALLPTYTFTSDTNTGPYSVGADDYGIATGGTLRFDISTSAITSTLSHLGPAGAATAGNLTYGFSGDTNTGIYSVGADDLGISTGGVLRFDVSTTATTSTLPFVAPAGAVGTPAYTTVGDLNNGWWFPGADIQAWSTSGTERMRLSATGILGVGTTTAPDGIHIIQTSSTTNTTLSVANRNTTTTTDAIYLMECKKGSTTNTAGTNRFIVFTINDGGTGSGYIGSNGANAAAFFSTSDLRLKENVHKVDGALDLIQKLNPVHYKWKNTPDTGTGFIAQELAKILPQLVHQTDDGESELNVHPWSFTESGMLPYVVRAIQEQQDIINDLTKRLEKLEKH